MSEPIDSIAPLGAATSMDLADSHGGQTSAPSSAAPARAARDADSPASDRAPSPPATGPSSLESLAAAVEEINARLSKRNRVLHVRTDADSGATSAEIRNAFTGQVLQRIPANDIAQLAAMLCGWAQGRNVLLDLTA